jgi:hypothetical protein
VNQRPLAVLKLPTPVGSFKIMVTADPYSDIYIFESASLNKIEALQLAQRGQGIQEAADRDEMILELLWQGYHSVRVTPDSCLS